MNIVLASHNAGKIREFKALLQKYQLNIIPQFELGVSDIEETGTTFIENALLKARHASRLTGLPAIADDSGLTVTALQGAPGIYSARYAGYNATANDNIQQLLTDLHDVPDEKRGAYFYCVLVFMSHEHDPAPLVCEGKWAGTILRERIGENGFGYDPIFYLPTLNKTAAELSLDIKNKISHRGLALQSLMKKLAEKK